MSVACSFDSIIFSCLVVMVVMVSLSVLMMVVKVYACPNLRQRRAAAEEGGWAGEGGRSEAVPAAPFARWPATRLASAGTMPLSHSSAPPLRAYIHPLHSPRCASFPLYTATAPAPAMRTPSQHGSLQRAFAHPAHLHCLPTTAYLCLPLCSHSHLP